MPAVRESPLQGVLDAPFKVPSLVLRAVTDPGEGVSAPPSKQITITKILLDSPLSVSQNRCGIEIENDYQFQYGRSMVING